MEGVQSIPVIGQVWLWDAWRSGVEGGTLWSRAGSAFCGAELCLTLLMCTEVLQSVSLEWLCPSCAF